MQNKGGIWLTPGYMESGCQKGVCVCVLWLLESNTRIILT